MTKPPENFEIQENPNYIVKDGDLFFSKRDYRWKPTRSSIGERIKDVIGKNIGGFATPVKNKVINNEPPKPKDDIPEPPEGFELLENCGEYKLIRGDKFINYKGDKNWGTVRDSAGETPNNLMRKHYYDCFYVAIKKNPKPRFETDKAYPWGY